MTEPRNLEELKGNITWEIENIDQKILKHVVLNLMKRCRICEVNRGRHFPTFIVKYKFLSIFEVFLFSF